MDHLCWTGLEERFAFLWHKHRFKKKSFPPQLTAVFNFRAITDCFTDWLSDRQPVFVWQAQIEILPGHLLIGLRLIESQPVGLPTEWKTAYWMTAPLCVIGSSRNSIKSKSLLLIGFPIDWTTTCWYIDWLNESLWFTNGLNDSHSTLDRLKQKSHQNIYLLVYWLIEWQAVGLPIDRVTVCWFTDWLSDSLLVYR